jgi:hypothetical protein
MRTLLRQQPRLPLTQRIQSGLAMPLKPTQSVPVGLAVADNYQLGH